VNHFYSDIIPQNAIFDEYTEEWASKLIKTLTLENSNKPRSEQKKVLLILDDLISDLNFHQSKTLKTIYSRGRHIGLSIILTTQYLNSISPLIRNNSDYIFVGQQNRSSVELLQSQFMSGNINKQEFLAMYYKNTVDFNFLVINCNSVVDESLNSIYGVIKTPEEEMDKKLEKVKQEEEEKPRKGDPSLWGSLFGEKPIVRITKPRNTVKQQIECMKPNIKPAFDI
jgi:hypothetical protein